MHSWGWAVSEVTCLSGGDYGRGHNESRLGAGDGVAVGGGAKPSPASAVREEHQLYYLYSSTQRNKSLPISQMQRRSDDIFKFEKNMCFRARKEDQINFFL